MKKKLDMMWEKVDKGQRVRCRYCLNERSKLESQQFMKKINKSRPYCLPELPSTILGEDFDCSEIEKKADQLAFSIVKLPNVVSI